MELDRDGHFSNQEDRKSVTARNKWQERKVDTTGASKGRRSGRAAEENNRT